MVARPVRSIFIAVACILSLASLIASVIAEEVVESKLRALRHLADEQEAQGEYEYEYEYEYESESEDSADLERESASNSTGNHDHGKDWPASDPEGTKRVKQLLEEYEANKGNRAEFPNIVQPISFINFVMKDGTGRNTYASFQRQIDQLNRAYSGEEAFAANYPGATDSKIRFKLAGVRYVVNDDYYNLCALPSYINVIRPKYMMDGALHLNVYVCWSQYNLGLSWLPYDSWYRQPVSESHYSLGAIIHSELLPGNDFNGGMWNQGDILTHEVGHSFGLKHPYEGDCYLDESNSDMIDDTPRMTGNPLKKCGQVSGRDSCPQPGKDDMSNYMVATNDVCRNHFTPGQVSFMQMVLQAYKPTLMKQLPPSCVAAIDSSDYSPDLQPCLPGTLKTTTDGGRWCKTDPDNAKVWAWACCPQSMDWDQMACFQGQPNFNLPNNELAVPKSGTGSNSEITPTDSGAMLTKKPTPTPTKKPTKRPTKRPTRRRRNKKKKNGRRLSMDDITESAF